ncbi:conserved hypothetical protein [Ricinus communis]|uniref:Uncharacterized protein n=1 Tax=Ricinus communis TaxID=3988 RepID=B9RU06_RICCO|nr:conserved hypothetical protein [Ricinus communis]
MDRANKSTMNSINDTEKYKDIFKLIDNRWECQLHRLFHTAGDYLNLEFYASTKLYEDEEVMKGFYVALQRLV